MTTEIETLQRMFDEIAEREGAPRPTRSRRSKAA